jgi:competence protein ComEA
MSRSFFPSLRRFMFLMLWAAAAAAGVPEAESVDVNSADAIELAARLSGVGMSRAEAIIHYRETQGPFEHPDDLVRVKGIGPKTLEKNRQRIRIGPPADSAQP